MAARFRSAAAAGWQRLAATTRTKIKSAKRSFLMSFLRAALYTRNHGQAGPCRERRKTCRECAICAGNGIFALDKLTRKVLRTFSAGFLRSTEIAAVKDRRHKEKLLPRSERSREGAPLSIVKTIGWRKYRPARRSR